MVVPKSIPTHILEKNFQRLKKNHILNYQEAILDWYNGY